MPRANGSLIITDPNAPHALEADTYTCAHCNSIIVLHDRNGARLNGVAVHCYQCDSLMCVRCAEQMRCTPFEKKLEAIEARDRLRAAAGL